MKKMLNLCIVKKMKKLCTNFSLFDAGICVQPSLPCLGASPDAKVYDPAAANHQFYGLLEIKCPFSKKKNIRRVCY